MATIIRASSSGGGTGDCASPAFLTASLAALRVALENDLDALQSALETAIADGNTSLLAAIESDLSTLGTAILNAVASVQTDTTAIKAKTDNLPANPASQTKLDTVEGLASGASGFAATKTVVDAIKLKTDNLPADPASGATLSGLIARPDSNSLQGTNEQTTGTSSSFSAYLQLIASTTKASPASSFILSLRNNDGAATKSIIQVAIGGAGAEVPIASAKVLIGGSGHATFEIHIAQYIPAGTRISIRSYVESATGGTLGIGWAMGQVA